MNLKVVTDYENIPAGTVLQEVTVGKKWVEGLWCSAAGSYKVKVPLSHCVPKKK